MESHSRHNLRNNNSLILECPSCTTKFAIDSNNVASIEEPVFHCSRCGHYFGLKDKKLEQQEVSTELTDTEFEKFEPTQLNLMPESLNPEPDFSSDITVKHNETKKITNINSWYKRNDIETLLEDDDIAIENKPTAQWPNQTEKSAISGNLKLSSESVNPLPKKKSYFFEKEESYQIDLSNYDHDEDDFEFEDYEDIELPKKKTGILSKLKTSKISNANSNAIVNALVILSIPTTFAILLAFWGFNIDKTPAFISSIFNLDSKLLATVAPPGLALSSLNPEIVSLDSGEKAFRIKGDVINSTSNTFSNIKLEAKLFTKDNRELVRVIAPLDNSLRDAKNIAALNIESIERLQTELTEDLTTIQPNVRVPFSLVVPRIKGEESWFSARIYSVNKI